MCNDHKICEMLSLNETVQISVTLTYSLIACLLLEKKKISMKMKVVNRLGKRLVIVLSWAEMCSIKSKFKFLMCNMSI